VFSLLYQTTAIASLLIQGR